MDMRGFVACFLVVVLLVPFLFYLSLRDPKGQRRARLAQRAQEVMLLAHRSPTPNPYPKPNPNPKPHLNPNPNPTPNQVNGAFVLHPRNTYSSHAQTAAGGFILTRACTDARAPLASGAYGVTMLLMGLASFAWWGSRRYVP